MFRLCTKNGQIHAIDEKGNEYDVGIGNWNVEGQDNTLFLKTLNSSDVTDVTDVIKLEKNKIHPNSELQFENALAELVRPFTTTGFDQLYLAEILPEVQRAFVEIWKQLEEEHHAIQKLKSLQPDMKFNVGTNFGGKYDMSTDTSRSGGFFFGPAYKNASLQDIDEHIQSAPEDHFVKMTEHNRKFHDAFHEYGHVIFETKIKEFLVALYPDNCALKIGVVLTEACSYVCTNTLSEECKVPPCSYAQSGRELFPELFTGSKLSAEPNDNIYKSGSTKLLEKIDTFIKNLKNPVSLNEARYRFEKYLKERCEESSNLRNFFFYAMVTDFLDKVQSQRTKENYISYQQQNEKSNDDNKKEIVETKKLELKKNGNEKLKGRRVVLETKKQEFKQNLEGKNTNANTQIQNQSQEKNPEHEKNRECCIII